MNNRGAIIIGPYYDPPRMLEAARLCETLDYDSVWIHDNMLVRPKYELLTCLAAVASITKKVKLSSGILIPQLRNPVWLALQTATVDILSNGRTFFAVGLGGGRTEVNLKEYDVVDREIGKRGIYYEETIEVLEKLWTEDHVTYRGKKLHLEDVSLGYKPIQKPHPPIFMHVQYQPPNSGSNFVATRAGWNPDRPYNFDKVLKRAARLADGMVTQQITPEGCTTLLGLFKDKVRECHRDPNNKGLALSLKVNVNSDANEAVKDARWFFDEYNQGTNKLDDESFNKWFIVGGADKCIERLGQFIDAGVTHFHIHLAAKDQLGQMVKFANEVLPSL